MGSDVRDLWQNLGAELGPLGYPITDEQDSIGSSVTEFTRGWIYWEVNRGLSVEYR